MSHIPNSAMPHAAPSKPQESSQNSEGAETSVRGRAGRIADTARANPGKTAAGVALAAGVLAAAAIPIVRARGKSADDKSAGDKSSGKSTTS
jgi:hypothetical protein